MKIQSINNSYNQKNVSHKAYFMQNDLFNKFVKDSGKTPIKDTLKKQFENLPNHKLEIIGMYEAVSNVYFNIYNHNTSALQNFKIKKDGIIFNNLLETFIRDVNTVFFKR